MVHFTAQSIQNGFHIAVDGQANETGALRNELTLLVDCCRTRQTPSAADSPETDN
jgi:hypothetical protein